MCLLHFNRLFSNVDDDPVIVVFSDIDECSLDIGPCDTNAECTNKIGSYICNCKTGYEGDGETCTGMYQ